MIQVVRYVSFSHGDVPAAKFYRTAEELEAIVHGFIRKVTSDGLKAEDIVILTATTTEKSWLDANRSYGGQQLSFSREPGKILFTTIRKFKGLEADAILIVDASTYSLAKPENKRLLYVGTSRAKNLLNIAMLDDVENTDMGDFLRAFAPGRNVPKNKKGLKRLLNITI